MPKVSICVPTYNNVKEVERLISSILKQTYEDYEIVITDDSDNNDIESLVRKFSDERISYVYNVSKLGHIFNWNAAIDMAKGDYIKIMFSDDWFTYTDSLSEFVEMLDTHPEADLAFSNSMQVSETESYKRKVSDFFIPRLKEDWRNIFLGDEIGAPSDTIYRRNGIKFDEKSSWASDVELYLQLLYKNPNFAWTDRPLVSIGLHEQQYTHTFVEKDERIFNDYLFMYQKHQLWESELCKDFFLKKFIIRYGKGIGVAKKCKIDPMDYIRAKMNYLFKFLMPIYMRAAGRKLCKWKTVIFSPKQ